MSRVAFHPSAPSPADFVHARWKFEYLLNLPGPFVGCTKLRFRPASHGCLWPLPHQETRLFQPGQHSFSLASLSLDSSICNTWSAQAGFFGSAPLSDIRTIGRMRTATSYQELYTCLQRTLVTALRSDAGAAAAQCVTLVCWSAARSPPRHACFVSWQVSPSLTDCVLSASSWSVWEHLSPCGYRFCPQPLPAK